MIDTPKLKLINSELSVQCENSEVLGIKYDLENGLIIEFEVNPKKFYEVHFNPFIYGFRVLDEGDLLEFWGMEEYKGFGIYEVLDGGWYALEKTRSGFLTGFTDMEYKEYLITGSNDCVSIITQPTNTPNIIMAATNNG